MINPQPLIVSRTYKTTAAILWRALTDPNEMKKWYFDLPGFKAEPGYQFSFKGGRDENNLYLHLCEVTEVVEQQKLTYSWRYDGYEGISHVSFELEEHKTGNTVTGTTVTITHTGLETFPASNPDLARENFAAGWSGFINKQLQQYIDNL